MCPSFSELASQLSGSSVFVPPGSYQTVIGIDSAFDEKDKGVDVDTILLHKIDIVMDILSNIDNTGEVQEAFVKVQGIKLTYKVHGEISKSDMEYMNVVFRKYRSERGVDKNTLDVLKRQFEQFNI